MFEINTLTPLVLALALAFGLLTFCSKKPDNDTDDGRRTALKVLFCASAALLAPLKTQAAAPPAPSPQRKRTPATRPASLDDLVAGVRNFQKEVFPSERTLFKQLASGQSPQVLFITCSDSRIDPAHITQTNPGDMFVLRNAGNFVPAYQHTGGEAATIEYAVSALKVKHIIIAGHSHCGAMHALLNPEHLKDLPAVAQWLKHAGEVNEALACSGKHLNEEALLEAAIKANVLVQQKNLLSHPSVARAIKEGKLALHSWVYELESGQVEYFDQAANQWLTL